MFALKDAGACLLGPVAHIVKYPVKFHHNAKLGTHIEEAVFVPDTVGDGEGYQLKPLASSRTVK